MATLLTVRDAYNRAKSLMHLRESVPRWIRDPDEILEQAWDVQFQMSTYDIPEKLLGKLLEIKQYEPSVTTVPAIPYTKYILLDEDTVKVIGVDMYIASAGEFKECSLGYSQDLGWAKAGNTFVGPSDDEPYAWVVGRVLYLCPIPSASSTQQLRLARIKRPADLTDLDDTLEVSDELKQCIPLWLASKFEDARGMADKAATHRQEFEALWLKVTGSKWAAKTEVQDEVKETEA